MRKYFELSRAAVVYSRYSSNFVFGGLIMCPLLFDDKMQNFHRIPFQVLRLEPSMRPPFRWSLVAGIKKFMTNIMHNTLSHSNHVNAFDPSKDSTRCQKMLPKNPTKKFLFRAMKNYDNFCTVQLSLLGCTVHKFHFFSFFEHFECPSRQPLNQINLIWLESIHNIAGMLIWNLQQKGN